MLFDSYDFFAFLIIVYILYIIFKPNLIRKWILLIASYTFYFILSQYYAILLLFLSITTYAIANVIGKTNIIHKKKLYLAFGILTSLSPLIFFKYSNFIILNINELLRHIPKYQINILNIIIPVGISFYIFRLIAYLIDCYRDKNKIEYNFIDYLAFISFFPHLIAGPIVRRDEIIPQIKNGPIINKTNLWIGFILIILGYLKKSIFADNLALYVNSIYNNPVSHNVLDFILAGYAYTLQIYADFSGYTDIALGIGFLFGYKLSLNINFNYPYMSRNPGDFWRRWHISLSYWFRDYLYIPLGGSRKGKTRTIINLMIVMSLCGLWHGANWNFLIWGVYHGILLIFHRLYLYIWPTDSAEKSGTHMISRLKSVLKIIIMFQFITIGWIIFRIEDLNKLKNIFSSFYNFSINSPKLTVTGYYLYFLIFSLIIFIINYSIIVPRKIKIKILKNPFNPYVISAFIVLIILIITFRVNENIQFIYFKF